MRVCYLYQFDRDASDAEKARKHLDGTYIGAAKIRVEDCKALAEKPRYEQYDALNLMTL